MGVGRGNESDRVNASAYQAISGTGLGAGASDMSEVEGSLPGRIEAAEVGREVDALDAPLRRRLLLFRELGSWVLGERGDAVLRSCRKEV